MPNALILILGRAALWQKRRASGRLRRSRLRCSCDAAKAQRVQFELLVPYVPGALPEDANSRECFARNAERAERLSRKGVCHRMSPSAKRALLPTKPRQQRRACARADCAAYLSGHSEASRPTFCRSPVRVPFGSYSATQRVALKRGAAGAGPANGTRSGAAAELGGSALWNRPSYK